MDTTLPTGPDGMRLEEAGTSLFFLHLQLHLDLYKRLGQSSSVLTSGQAPTRGDAYAIVCLPSRR
jgi:hypothetical protein